MQLRPRTPKYQIQASFVVHENHIVDWRIRQSCILPGAEQIMVFSEYMIRVNYFDASEYDIQWISCGKIKGNTGVMHSLTPLGRSREFSHSYFLVRPIRCGDKYCWELSNFSSKEEYEAFDVSINLTCVNWLKRDAIRDILYSNDAIQRLQALPNSYVRRSRRKLPDWEDVPYFVPEIVDHGHAAPMA